MTPDVPTRYEPPLPPAISRSRLADEVRSLGVDHRDVVMVHTSMRNLGWMIGGADTVVRGLLDAVGAAGTIVAMTGAHNDTWYGFDRWPAALRHLYTNEMPAFDPAISESTPDVGRVPERIRTWPGAMRSDHPESSLVAIGPKAAWLTDPHPLDFHPAKAPRWRGSSRPTGKCSCWGRRWRRSRFFTMRRRWPQRRTNGSFDTPWPS